MAKKKLDQNEKNKRRQAKLAQKKRKNIRNLIIGIVSILVLIATIFIVLFCIGKYYSKSFDDKITDLKNQVISAETQKQLGESPALDAGYAVFLSVCDKTERASVFTGTGSTLEKAWEQEMGLRATASIPYGSRRMW